MTKTNTAPDAPADTRLMGIIHEALRRDLRRTRAALTETPAPDRHQREALAGHLGWMMQFLHAHHRTEDEGLYPMVRARDPHAAVLLDQMHDQHTAIAPAIAAVNSALRTTSSLTTGTTISASSSVRRSTGSKTSCCPICAARRTRSCPSSPLRSPTASCAAGTTTPTSDPSRCASSDAKATGSSMDSPPGTAASSSTWSRPVPRFVLLYGFACSYRRQRAECWGTTTTARRDVQKEGYIEAVVDAVPEAVWDIVRDPTRVGEWSHECVGADWLGGATSAAPGARFRGSNRSGLFRWGRVCEVTKVGHWELVWRTVPTRFYPDSSEWRIALQPVEGGTRIEQTFRVLKAPRFLEPIYATLVPNHRDRTEALTTDLRRLGALAARATTTIAAGPT